MIPRPYAGYDPNENDFSDVPMAPLHEEDLVDYGNGVKRRCGDRWGSRDKCINPARALELRKQGLSYRVIGKRLAAEIGRRTPFGYYAVYMAIYRLKGQNKNNGQTSIT